MQVDLYEKAPVLILTATLCISAPLEGHAQRGEESNKKYVDLISKLPLHHIKIS